MSTALRMITADELKEILKYCAIFENSRRPKDYDSGVAQGRKDAGYKIISILKRDMPEIVDEIAMELWRDSVCAKIWGIEEKTKKNLGQRLRPTDTNKKKERKFYVWFFNRRAQRSVEKFRGER